MPANAIFNLIPSSSILASDGRTPVLAPFYKDALDNRNAPNGAVVADADGKVFGRWFVSADTADAVNITVPALGEIVFKNDLAQLVVGNGLILGGVPVNLSSFACLYVSADGTEAKNGQSLSDIITRAGQRLPYGQPLSPTNQVTVVVGPGNYDLTTLAATITIPNYVNVVGLCGSAVTNIITSSSRRFQCVTAAGVSHYLTLRGLTFKSVTPSSSLVFNFSNLAVPQFFYVDLFDLQFPGLTNAQSCMTLSGGTGLDTPTFVGKCVEVHTNGMGMMGGHTSTPVVGFHTYNIDFINCSGGDRSFGGSNTAIGTRDGQVYGRLVNCRHTGTGANAWSAKLFAKMLGCDWQPAIQRVGINAEISNSVIRESVGGFSVSNGGQAITIPIVSSRLNAVAGNGVLNGAATKLDNAGNIVG